MPLVVAITGASQGIGATLALQCARAGHSVILVARTEDALKTVTQQCNDVYTQSSTDAKAIYVVGDATKRETFERVVETATTTFGGLDVLVNNAGQGITKQTSALTEEEFDAMINTNTKGPLWGMQVAVAHFKSKAIPTGMVINVSSMLGRIPTACQRSAYAAAKHALNSLTCTFREELCDGGYAGILMCSFHPGVVGTAFGLNSVNGGFDNRLLPDAQPVEEVAGVLLEQIAKGAAAMAAEQERMRGKEERDEAGNGVGSTVFGDGTGIYDVYSRPEYKRNVELYFGAEDMCKRERQVRAAYMDAVRKSIAERARLAAQESSQ